MPVATNFTASARAVFRQIIKEGISTRPDIGRLLNLSRPTMSAAIAELERVQYVEATGVVKGAVGRRATRYRAGTGAGHVISIDAGSTHIRLRVSTLDRRLLHSRVCKLPVAQIQMTQEISVRTAEEMQGALAAATEDWGPLRAVGIALPTRVVGPEGNAAETRQEILFSAFQPPEDVALVLENNVNCAAVAEGLYGVAREEATFAYIQIGLKIGMGLILDGHLIRGRSGAAGEIGHLPYPFAPDRDPEAGALERHLGTEALMERVRTNWPADAGPGPKDSMELLRLAADKAPAAQAHVSRHGSEVGALVAACVSIVDPGIVVLGGGYGSSPLLLQPVLEAAQRLAYHVDLRSSALGADATVLGIEKLAIDEAIKVLLGD